MPINDFEKLDRAKKQQHVVKEFLQKKYKPKSIIDGNKSTDLIMNTDGDHEYKIEIKTAGDWCAINEIQNPDPDYFITIDRDANEDSIRILKYKEFKKKYVKIGCFLVQPGKVERFIYVIREKENDPNIFQSIKKSCVNDIGIFWFKTGKLEKKGVDFQIAHGNN